MRQGDMIIKKHDMMLDFLSVIRGLIVRLLLVLIMTCGGGYAAHAVDATALPPSSLRSQPYVLGAGDTIEVYVVNQPDLTTRTRINADNSVVLPLIGRVIVGGKSILDAQSVVEQRYVAGRLVVNPQVRIEVTAYDSQRISVLGQVNLQGIQSLDRPYTLLEILARAGGLSEESADFAWILRTRPDGSAERQIFDLNKLYRGLNNIDQIIVRAGDVVYVPRTRTISVVGAVNKPGNFRLLYGMTVQQALATAGDLTRLGTVSDLKVRRTTPDGLHIIVPVGLDDTLDDGDVVIVKERLF